MSKTKKWLLPVLAIAFCGSAVAQTLEQKFYKLEFILKEVEAGKTVNTRSFSTMLGLQMPGRESSKATIRASGRVAVPASPGSGSFSWVDLGANIDCSDMREMGADLTLFVTASMTTLAQDNPNATPVTRSNQWNGTVTLPVKKPTVLFTSDDMNSKRQIQLELTATPIK